MSPGEALLQLYGVEKGRVSIASFVFAQEDVDLTIEHPISIVISDGIHTEGKPHPRLYGTFPKFIKEYGIERSLGLEEAVKKVTSAPARQARLADRGSIVEGHWADITVFDPTKIKDTATYENPVNCAQGIEYVLINGSVVLKDGQLDPGIRGTGHILRRTAAN